MDCCGTPSHQISVQAGATNLSLLRCSHCSQQTWTVDGREVSREEAFAHLSDAYKDIPQAAQAARARTARDRVVRAERRAAQAVTAIQTDEISLTEHEAQCEPKPQLAELLEGWQVLGTAV